MCRNLSGAARRGAGFFSHVIICPAGWRLGTRPDPVRWPRAIIRDQAFGLVRVLDGAGQAVGPWNPRLCPGDAANVMLRDMAMHPRL
jgi:2-oxoisovalerate dehydrogenase E1 component alpha subunit